MKERSPQGGSAPGISRAALLGLVGSGAAVAAALVRGKVAAVVLGPAGVGIAAEVLQVATISFLPLVGLSGPALTRALVGPTRASAPGPVLASALSWTALGAVLLTVVTALATPALVNVPSGSAPVLLGALAALGAAATATLAVLSTALAAGQGLKALARNQLILALLGAALASALVLPLGVAGQLLGLAVGSLLAVPLYWASVRGQLALQEPLRPRLDPSFLAEAGRMGATSLIAGAAGQLALFVVRKVLDENGGPAWNGQFQAAWSIGSLYLGLLLNGLSSFAQPRIAGAEGAEELRAEVQGVAAFLLRVVPPVVLGVVAAREVALRLLYSHEFDAAVPILGWQLVGDVMRCLGWAYATPLLLRGRRRAYLVTESLAGLLFGGVAVLLVPRLGPVGAGIAYCVEYCLYAPVCALVLQASCGVRVSLPQLGRAALTTLGLGLFLVFLDTSWAFRLAGLGVAAVWFLWASGMAARARTMLGGAPPPAP